MTGYEEIDCGVEYKVIKVNDNMYFLLPLRLIDGYASDKIFYNKKEHTILNTPKDLKNNTKVVDSIYSVEDLCTIYDMDDINFVKEYYYNEISEEIFLITIKDNKLIRSKIPINVINKTKPVEEYSRQKGKPSVTLNGVALENLLGINDIETIKIELLRYKNLITKFRDREKKSGITRLLVENGHVKEIDANSFTKKEIKENGSIQKSISNIDTIVSLKGLETHMKERVFGHDEEIRAIAKTILMNYTAIEGEKNEPILLIGPTGTGKTETMKAAIDYLDIPLLEINAANLVPQGIKGMSIEDCLYSLIVSSSYDIEKAQRGLVFFDEFDKLGEIDYDSKSAVAQILLKFVEGDTFMIDKPSDDYNFNTRSLIKIFAGAFSQLFVESKSIGFASSEKTKVFDPRKITETEYYGKELVTRIPHIFVYHELSREMQKKVILKSKLSEFLLKKQRYERQFGVLLEADNTYIDCLLDTLHSHEKSMRDLNNLIIKSLSEAEYEMLLEPNKYSRLVLTSDTVNDNKKFDLS